MKKYDTIVIGFGKAGKTLAKKLAKNGQSIAMIEKSAKMYGGTCINIACIPTKTLLHEGLTHHDFKDAYQRKQAVVATLNQKNYDNLAQEPNIDIYTNHGQFIDNSTVAILDEKQEVIEELQAEHIIINTGALPNIPPIKGVETSQRLYDSTGIMEIAEQPKQLIIIGAGPIGLEFATFFRSIGTEVTIIHMDKHILSNEDRDIGGSVYENLQAQGIKMVDEAEIQEFIDQADQTLIRTNQGDYQADAVLLATGRKANTENLGLEHTDVQISERGHIEVNPHLQTAVPQIYAVGDVNGGLQFTYISLDDSRIVYDHLVGEGNRTTENRGAVPYAIFLDPPLARVGLTASAAKKEGYTIKEGSIAVKAIPRHAINHDDRGLFKVVINADNDLILGASLYGKEAEELINLIKIAIDEDISYTVLRDAIYTHPTMAEAFNDLFNI